MSLLCSIIQKLINKNFFIDVNAATHMEYWETIHKNVKTFQAWEPDFFLYFYCANLTYSKIAEKTFIENKFHYLNQHLANIFASKNVRDDFLTIFQKAQRVYGAFGKLANAYKYKKSTVKINVDVYMNELKENQRNVIPILQNGSKYLFVGSDLIKLINSALSNSVYFFPEPLHPKNPFTNLPFDHSTLYNIYFHIHYNCHQTPTLFHLFFKSNFNLNKFLYDNESIIRDTNIKNYVNNSPSNILHHDLMNMLSSNYKYTKKLFINNEIPKEIIVDIFRPYFHLYFTFKYGVNGTEKKNRSFIELKNRLRDFVIFNPAFGRKICKIEKNFVCTSNNGFVLQKKKTYSFNLKHINFYKAVPSYTDEEAEAEAESDIFVSLRRRQFYSPRARTISRPGTGTGERDAHIIRPRSASDSDSDSDSEISSARISEISNAGESDRRVIRPRYTSESGSEEEGEVQVANIVIGIVDIIEEL